MEKVPFFFPSIENALLKWKESISRKILVVNIYKIKRKYSVTCHLKSSITSYMVGYKIKFLYTLIQKRKKKILNHKMNQLNCLKCSSTFLTCYKKINKCSYTQCQCDIHLKIITYQLSKPSTKVITS